MDADTISDVNPSAKSNEEAVLSTHAISESTFVLTELRYTLGQLHVQIGDLDQATRESTACGDLTVEQVLQSMVANEKQYQERYQQLLQSSLPPPVADEDIALPVESAEAIEGAQGEFERARTRTIELLSGLGDEWPHDVLELARQQVADDRRETTSIANCRKELFEADQRLDLLEPITEHPEPHEQTKDEQ